MNRVLLGALAGITLLIGAFYAGARHGEVVRDAHYASVLADKEAAMASLRKAARERLTQREADLQGQVNAQNARIAKLLKENHDFEAWYKSRPPVDVGDLIYGVQ